MTRLTLSGIQEIAKSWVDEKGFKWSIYADYCHLVEEVGELGEAITVDQGERVSGSGEKGLADHSDLNEEIGDVLFSIVVLANKFSLDLEEVFNDTLKRYDKKMEKTK